jgi:hypothetical protein
MNIFVNKKKNWIKPAILGLPVKSLTLHGPSYAPNESVGSSLYSPKHIDDPGYTS